MYDTSSMATICLDEGSHTIDAAIMHQKLLVEQIRGH